MPPPPATTLVIGAGPAGLTAAAQLVKAGAGVTVFEAGPAVGGMARSMDLWGQRVDLGPHRFFSSDTRVNEIWLEHAGRDYAMVDRLTRIYYRGRFFQYPIKAFDALSRLGVLEAAACTLSYAGERLRPTAPDGSFESWVVGRFGRRLYEIFFRTYSEKLWGIPCSELDADFAAQRIKKLSLFEAIRSAFFGGGGGRHKTLVEQFAYPLRGAGVVYERMADFIRARGGQVALQAPVKAVLVEGGAARGVELEDGRRVEADHVISTMPITLLVERLAGVPGPVLEAARALTFRNTLLVYLNVGATDLFPDQWLYIHAPELKTGRITNFRNWVPSLHGGQPTSILAMEYWCTEADPIWRATEAELVALAGEELRRTGLLGGAKVLDGKVVRLPRCYPVYRRGYREPLKVVEAHLRSIPHLQVIGRYGAFKYNNQDHSILMGRLAAENVLGQGAHDVWSVNTDYETYQERSIITRTGLVAA